MDFTDSDSEAENEDIWLRLRNVSLEDENKRLKQTMRDAEESFLIKIDLLEKEVRGVIVKISFFCIHFI